MPDAENAEINCTATGQESNCQPAVLKRSSRQFYLNSVKLQQVISWHFSIRVGLAPNIPLWACIWLKWQKLPFNRNLGAGLDLWWAAICLDRLNMCYMCLPLCHWAAVTVEKILIETHQVKELQVKSNTQMHCTGFAMISAADLSTLIVSSCKSCWSSGSNKGFLTVVVTKVVVAVVLAVIVVAVAEL